MNCPLPSILHIRRPGTAREPGTLVTQIGAEIKKRLTPTLELSVSGGLSHLNSDEKRSQTGFDNLAIGLKYQVFTSESREAVLSAALGWEVGGTGRKATGPTPQGFSARSGCLLVTASSSALGAGPRRTAVILEARGQVVVNTALKHGLSDSPAAGQ